MEGNSTNTCIRSFSFLVVESPWTSIKQNQTLTTHNANRHCRERFYTFVGSCMYKRTKHTTRQLIMKCIIVFIFAIFSGKEMVSALNVAVIFKKKLYHFINCNTGNGVQHVKKFPQTGVRLSHVWLSTTVDRPSIERSILFHWPNFSLSSIMLDCRIRSNDWCSIEFN